MLYVVALAVGFIIAKLMNPKDPVMKELKGYAEKGHTVLYAVDGQAIVLKMNSAGVVEGYAGTIEIGALDVSTVGTSFDH